MLHPRLLASEHFYFPSLDGKPSLSAWQTRAHPLASSEVPAANVTVSEASCLTEGTHMGGVCDVFGSRWPAKPGSPSPLQPEPFTTWLFPSGAPRAAHTHLSLLPLTRALGGFSAGFSYVRTAHDILVFFCVLTLFFPPTVGLAHQISSVAMCPCSCHSFPVTAKPPSTVVTCLLLGSCGP